MWLCIDIGLKIISPQNFEIITILFFIAQCLYRKSGGICFMSPQNYSVGALKFRDAYFLFQAL